MLPRIMKFHCKYCSLDFERLIQFGHFVRIDVGSNAEIIQERPAQTDSCVETLICPNCGCCSGLDFKKDNVAVTPNK